LHDAVARGDVEAVARILDEDPGQILLRDDFGRTALACALDCCDEDIRDVIRVLLERGVDVNAQDIYGKAAVHYLEGEVADHGDIVQMLLDAGYDPEIKNVLGYTALQYACLLFLSGDGEPALQLARQYIDAGAYYDLWSACALADLDRVCKLLRESPGLPRVRVAPDIRDLLEDAVAGMHEVIELARKGLSNAQAVELTAEMLRQRLPILDLLVSHGAAFGAGIGWGDVLDRYDRECLMFAKLLELGAVVHFQGDEGAALRAYVERLPKEQEPARRLLRAALEKAGCFVSSKVRHLPVRIS
jgi:Ankyrin repeat